MCVWGRGDSATTREGLGAGADGQQWAMCSRSCLQHCACLPVSLHTVLWGTVLLYFAIFVFTFNSLRPHFFLVIPAIHNYQLHCFYACFV